MKKYILAAVISTLCLGPLHAGVDPNDANLIKAKALPADKSEQNAADSSERLFDFYASDKAAQLRYERDGKFFGAEEARMSLSFLISETRDNLFTVGLSIDTDPQYIPGLSIGVGSKFYAALLGQENADVSAVAVGLDVGIELPIERFPLEFDASVYYAPDVLTFGQSDRIIDWQINAGLGIRKNVTGYVGFRFLQFDTRPGDRELDDRFHVGIRWTLGDS